MQFTRDVKGMVKRRWNTVRALWFAVAYVNRYQAFTGSMPRLEMQAATLRHSELTSVARRRHPDASFKIAARIISDLHLCIDMQSNQIICRRTRLHTKESCGDFVYSRRAENYNGAQSCLFAKDFAGYLYE